ncbi:MAG: prolyl-tRNA synthetase [Thermales bacterium]|nr:prolyl-tRNA synthetase [Thermales bacterium]
MKYSNLFSKTSKNIPSDEVSKNAQLLIKAGYVDKTMAGVYAMLPLGLRTLNNIENIIRQKMNEIGGQEILMNCLHPKSNWENTGRWDTVDVLFKLKSQTENEYALAPTHEEQISPIIKSFVNSYKDLPDYNPLSQTFPLSVYQIQTKFRDELRSKAGLMRGREFRMKDLYDFHKNIESQKAYFELITQKYMEIFEELGLGSRTYYVDASGGSFSDKFSREFQTICEAGEDEITFSPSTRFAANVEVKDEALQKYGQVPIDLQTAKSVEVGNIFDLCDTWTKAFDITYIDENNQKQYPTMGCHGIGSTRCMGVIAEIYNDDGGLIWPESVAPFKYHLITNINPKDDESWSQKIMKIARKIYLGELEEFGAEQVFWDDRENTSLGQKFGDAQLMGMPYQLVLTKRSLESGGVELVNRKTAEKKIISIS